MAVSYSLKTTTRLGIYRNSSFLSKSSRNSLLAFLRSHPPHTSMPLTIPGIFFCPEISPNFFLQPSLLSALSTDHLPVSCIFSVRPSSITEGRPGELELSLVHLQSCIIRLDSGIQSRFEVISKFLLSFLRLFVAQRPPDII